MNYLVDVNVWVALATPGHIHHTAALDWFQGTTDDRFLFCRVTQMGLLRLVTNPRVMGISVVTADSAWKVFDAFLQDDRITYADEPPETEELWRKQTRLQGTGPNTWTDAYLAAFASAGGLTIATFDRQFAGRKDVSVRVLR